MNLITAKDIGFAYASEESNAFSLRKISFEIHTGDFVSVIGRNGSGKSTLVKLLANQFRNYEGAVELLGKDLKEYDTKEFARISAFLPQNVPVVNDSVSLRELLLLGRYPYKSAMGFKYSREDAAIVDDCMNQLGLDTLKNSLYGELSGGQKQRALIALTLVQLDITGNLSGKLLIVDEPLTFLDVNHQYEVFNLLKEFNNRGLTVIAVVHDLNIALKYSGKCILLNSGEVARYDDTNAVITEAMLREHFMIESRITEYEKSYFINYLT